MATTNELPTGQTALIVLGMHRSGTSALTGVLGLMGCELPKGLMPPDRNNPKGYFESLKTCYFNDELLGSLGSSWDDWRSLGSDWSNSPGLQQFHRRAAAIITEDFGTPQTFVLKDPRICRLLPFWTRVLDDANVSSLFVFVHRDPHEVAASLARREGSLEVMGLLRWLRHVLDAEAGSRGRPRVFVSYDLLLQDWRDVVRHIGTKLNFAWPRSIERAAPAIEEFLSNDLRHFSSGGHEHNREAADGWIEKVHTILDGWVTHGESEKDYATLDAVRDALGSATSMFESLLQHTEQQRAEAQAMREEIELRLAHLETRNMALETSTSWRITAPLRWTLLATRGLRKPAS